MKLERSWGVLFALLLCATTALALPLTIDSVELDEVRLDSGSVNRLDVERDDDFTLRIKLTPTAQLDNVEILAFISGYEHNDRPNERISDVAELFTADANVSYVRKLKLQLPNELDRDDYKIRLIVSDRFGTAVVQDFDLHVNSQRHDVLIKDITTI
ncbi:MAG: hypothetical protein QGG83_05045, partial [Candidatus Woesearchaeota archaeon]|nr:hypothetical protein [Candidatus Woesearchaeota archaeon]